MQTLGTRWGDIAEAERGSCACALEAGARGRPACRCHLRRVLGEGCPARAQTRPCPSGLLCTVSRALRAFPRPGPPGVPRSDLPRRRDCVSSNPLLPVILFSGYLFAYSHLLSGM